MAKGTRKQVKEELNTPFEEKRITLARWGPTVVNVKLKT